MKLPMGVLAGVKASLLVGEVGSVRCLPFKKVCLSNTGMHTSLSNEISIREVYISTPLPKKQTLIIL